MCTYKGWDQRHSADPHREALQDVQVCEGRYTIYDNNIHNTETNTYIYIYIHMHVLVYIYIIMYYVILCYSILNGYRDCVDLLRCYYSNTCQ